MQAVKRIGRRVRDAVNSLVSRIAGMLGLGSYVVLDYPPSAALEPRYGHGRPAHPGLARIIGAYEDRYREAIESLATHLAELRSIPVRSEDPLEPSWVNEFLPGLDAGAIYGFIRERRPGTYLEIGSGTSTRFAARAVRDGGLETRIVSIDPDPRTPVDELCDERIRSPLESLDLSRFGELRSNDVVFFDGSHRVFTNSDATTFFLDVLPGVPPGVLVGIHDVYLPYDYPPDVMARHYSEQYLLAAYLLGGGERMLRPTLAAEYVRRSQDLDSALAPLWESPGFGDVETHGCAFWLEALEGGESGT